MRRAVIYLRVSTIEQTTANQERELREVQLASQTAPWLFIAGVMLQLPTLAWVGVILFGASSVFALITLPVEFNASARAQELLIGHGIIRGDEQIAGVQKVLGAAAWTYVL